MARFSERHFETAREMLDYLNPLDTDRWAPGQFIFRGQPRCDLGLTPSSHRVEGDVTGPKRWGTNEVTCGDQVQFEQEVLEHFIQACDSSGLQIPGDNAQLRLLVEDPTARWAPHIWPPLEYHHALAFAQHHGVPTCLLDWSRRAHVAAYFAASSALAGRREENQRIAVWALNRRAKPVRVIEAPGSTSPNLAAQSGVFTAEKPVTFPDRDKALENAPFLPVGMQYRDDLYQHPIEPFVLERITLNIEQAGQLLLACELLGVSGATMFPGYEGISRKVRDWANAEHKGFDPKEMALRDII